MSMLRLDSERGEQVKGERHPEKIGRKNNRRLRVVRIRYVPTPDADWRLRRAIALLLRAAATVPKGSVGAKKEGETPQDSRPEKIAGQSDGGKDES